MKNFLLQVSTDSLISDPIEIVTVPSLHVWFYIAISEFIIIIFLLWKIIRKPKSLDLIDVSKVDIRKAKNSKIDMNDLMNNINRSKALYKNLSRACHPDRFVNSENQQVATEIFQGISDHKRDFQKLMELKTRAEKELNINFK